MPLARISASVIGKIAQKIAAFLLIFFLTFYICLPDVNGQTNASITRLSVSKNSSFLLAYFQIQDGVTAEVSQALNSGVAVRFTYLIELSEPKMFMDTTVAQIDISRTVSYDSLRQEYLVYLGTDQPRAISVRGSEEMEKLVFQLNAIRIAPIGILKKGVDYRLKARAKVEKVDMRLPFSNILETFSRWGYQTDWHETSFKY